MNTVAQALLGLALLGLLAGPAAATDRIRLDGQHATQANFDGQVAGTSGTAPFGVVLVSPPVAPPGCTAPGCERFPVSLTLPGGMTRGTLQSRVWSDGANVGVTYRLVDREGTVLASSHMQANGVDSGGYFQAQVLTIELGPGSYALEVLNGAGNDSFKGTVAWHAGHREDPPVKGCGVPVCPSRSHPV